MIFGVPLISPAVLRIFLGGIKGTGKILNKPAKIVLNRKKRTNLVFNNITKLKKTIIMFKCIVKKYRCTLINALL
jgi:hypothetical protein